MQVKTLILASIVVVGLVFLVNREDPIGVGLSRAFPAKTTRSVPGTTRNACAVKNDLMKPISEPIFRAASWPVALAYSPRDGST